MVSSYTLVHYAVSYIVPLWANVELELANLVKKLPSDIEVNALDVQQVDSAGALLLFNLIATLTKLGKSIKSTQWGSECETLFQLIKAQQDTAQRQIKFNKLPNLLYKLGVLAVNKFEQGLKFIAFIGIFVESVGHLLRHLRHPPWKSVLVTVDEAGYQALPIVALLIFLVGVVITFQMAMQLETYGANIYVVDLAGFIIFREFAPLITAIIAAARTSTAFTAQIGTMKVNEELDALKTMGVPPMERLVVPKVIALLIALPLLTVWADVFGILGAMLMADAKLNIGAVAFLDRFQHVIQVKQLVVGLVKVPVFALVIALVGCFQGFCVKNSADDVGRKTTKAAVQTIFLIIIVDAAFSIFFSIRGI